MNPQNTTLTSFSAPALLKTSSNHDPLLSQAFYDPHVEDLTPFGSETSSSNVGVAPQFAMTFLQYLEESESSGNSGYIEDDNMGEIGFNPESFVFSDPQQHQPQYHFIDDSINNIANSIPKTEKSNPSSNFGQTVCTIPQPISSGAALIPPEVLQQQQLRHELRILGVPSKSRVETQLKLCIQLVQKHAQPGNTSNVTSYKYLLLPESFTVGSKTSKKDIKVKIEPSLSCLRLEAGVVCASDQSKEVARCFGCIQRERKITQRKKKADDFEENTTTNQGQFIDEERKKILQFYANPQIDFGFGETILPTRITCYCRHHEERTGFQIWIVLRDSKTNQAVAAAISPPVMITDDHKSKAKQPTQPNLGGMKRQRLAEAISAVPVATPVVISPASTPVPTPFFNPNPMIPANFNLKKEEFIMQQDSPVIEKIIPSEGPVTGGIEVTILGKDFISTRSNNSSHAPNVIVLFGECEALKTSVWGSQTLVSVVPPSLFPGAVPVSIKGAKNPTQEPVFFTYKDDTDRMMMELALQVVGVKLTGKIDDAKQIALKIVNSNQDTFTRAMQLQQQQQQNGRQNSHLEESAVHYYHKNTEDLIYFCISQLFENHNMNGFVVDLNTIKYKGTQHTLLMLAVIQGAHNLVELCLKHGADVNVQDANGYTALHYAAMHGYIAMTKLLLTQSHNNVDLSLKTITGKTPVKIAQEYGNSSIMDILNHYMINGNRFGSVELNAGTSYSSNINMNLNVNVNVSYSTPSGPHSRRASFSKELVNPSHIQIPLPTLIPTLHPAHNHPLMQEEKDDVRLLVEEEVHQVKEVPKKLPETCRTESMNTPFALRPFGNFFAERRQLWTVVMAVVVGTLMVSVVILPLSVRDQGLQKTSSPSGSVEHNSASSGSTTAGVTSSTKDTSSEDISLKFLVLAVYFLMAVLIMLPLFYRYRKVWKVKQVLYGLGILLVMFGYLIFEYWGDEQ